MNKKNTKPAQKSRRDALTKIAAVGAVPLLLPEQWTKPLTNAVFSPAHAQMSPMTGTDGDSDSADLMCGVDMLEFRTPGTYTITLPSDALSISVVVAGASGGIGGNGGDGADNSEGDGGAGGIAVAGPSGREIPKLFSRGYRRQ